MPRRCCAQIVVAELGFLAALSSPPAACALVVAAARLLTEARTNAEGPEDQSWEASRIKLGVSAYVHPHTPKHSRERETETEGARERRRLAVPFGTSGCSRACRLRRTSFSACGRLISSVCRTILSKCASPNPTAAVCRTYICLASVISQPCALQPSASRRGEARADPRPCLPCSPALGYDRIRSRGWLAGCSAPATRSTLCRLCQLLDAYVNNEYFNAEVVRRSAAAAAHLAEWVVGCQRCAALGTHSRSCSSAAGTPADLSTLSALRARRTSSSAHTLPLPDLGWT